MRFQKITAQYSSNFFSNSWRQGRLNLLGEMGRRKEINAIIRSFDTLQCMHQLFEKRMLNILAHRRIN